MFARSLRPLAAKGARQASSSSKHSSVNGKGAFNALYGAFMKNNMTYVTSIVVAAIAVEAVYGSATNYIWESANRGRLYHHIDWSQFKTDDDDEEEEEEEEAEEEAADEGDDVVDDLHDDDEE